MDEAENSGRTLTDDQIRVTGKARSGVDVLQSAKPFFEAALKSMQDSKSTKYEPISVPPNVIRDLVLMLAAEIKRADAINARPRTGNNDPGDGDWNPFKRVDFEFD